MTKYAFHYDEPKVADPGDELGIQTRLRARAKMLAPTMRLVATPNGGKRTAWEKLRAGREGLVIGWPDITAIAPGFIAFLEIKQRAGALSDAQVDCLNWLHRAGYPCGCFRSVDSAVAFLRAAGAPLMDIEEAAA